MPDMPDANGERRRLAHDDVLSACQIEIETGWNDGQGDAPVRRLAEAHPELADELFEFFQLVVDAEGDLDRVRPEFAEMDRRVRALIRRTSKAREG